MKKKTLTQRMNGFKKGLMIICFSCLLSLGLATQNAYAQLAEEVVVNDFADYVVRLVDNPISKILAVIILITAVFYLFQAEYGKAVAAALAFGILIFLPQIITTFS